MTETTLYCELMTNEQVVEFESLMVQYGHTVGCRPMVYARRLPSWVEENRERESDEDPLAVIILSIDHERKRLWFDAGNRCLSGRKISPEQMKMLFFIHHYERITFSKK